MGWRRAGWGSALALLLAACGNGLEDARPRTPSLEVEQDRSEEGTRMEVRVRGTHGLGLETVLVGVRELRVTHAGAELPVDVVRAPMDLALGHHAWLAGTFQVPDDARTVRVTLTLDAAGGFEDAVGAGDLDARGVPLHFELPLKAPRTRGHVVVHLDLARSMLDAGEERKLLLPQYTVHH